MNNFTGELCDEDMVTRLGWHMVGKHPHLAHLFMFHCHYCSTGMEKEFTQLHGYLGHIVLFILSFNVFPCYLCVLPFPQGCKQSYG